MLFSWRTLGALFALFLGSACTETIRGPAADVELDTSRVDAGMDAATDSGDSGPSDAMSDAMLDGGMLDGAMDMGPDAPEPTGAVLYPEGDRHSPITADLALSLSTLSERERDDDAIMKVGDSITVSRSFLLCLEGSSLDLDGRELDGTVARFSGFDRASLAATVGWSASAARMGTPSPLQQEMDATEARFATLMFGTNDAGFRSPQDFARDIWVLADTLLSAGTIPLLSTIPARADSVEANARVRAYNLAVRAIAQGRGVPLVDYHRALAPLPNQGLGGDDVHPSSDSRGACILDDAGLQNGYNVRNLLTLEQLERAASALMGEESDASALRLAGEGSMADPFIADLFPFAVTGDTSASSSRVLDEYPCGTSAEAGPEQFYRLEIDAPGTLTTHVLSAEGVDVDVYVMRDEPTIASCVDRDDTNVRVPVEAGVWWVIVDTFSGGAEERPGEYLILVDLE